VNSLFAGVVRKHTSTEDFLWVNDYHLIPLARSLKEKGVQRNCFFFLHITFPPRDILLKLPWREELVKDLMEYRLIGFQTWRDRRNFIDCLRVFDPSTKVRGRGPVVSVEAFGRTVKVASLPISIDYGRFAEMADSPEARQRIREIRADFAGRTMLLGVDRLDYTKGIPQKLLAFRTALENYPELREKISLLQILVPSREDVPAYRELKGEIEQLVSRINGEFSTSGWVPIRYVHRSIPREELVAVYRAADIGIVTSLKDGMNLVAKEYCASHTDNDGVLILSEFAGSASQLKKNALLVNPYDREGVASAILRAYSMTEKEKYNRMSSMRRSIRKRDVFWWVNNFLRASMDRQLHDFPEREMAPLLPQGRVHDH
jgi:trehalose 6-phosphate synthase